jgi:hypothetical protein
MVLVPGGAVLAAPANDQGSDAPDVGVIIRIHYPHGISQVDTGGIQLSQYQYSGIHWDNPSINYYVNIGKQDSAFLGGIRAAFQTWDDVSVTFTASYSGATKSSPLTLQAKWNRRLQQFVGAQNVVGWKNLSQYPGAIAITYEWYYGVSLGDVHLIEVDTALNSSSMFHWWQISVIGDPDTATWPSGQESAAYDVDVQNIMIHEAGHWLVLDDLYDSADMEQTMYGYADEKELKKRSLEDGDIAGIIAIYGS